MVNFKTVMSVAAKDFCRYLGLLLGLEICIHLSFHDYLEPIAPWETESDFLLSCIF